MKSTLFLLCLLPCCLGYAQPIDARDSLIYPVNPPREKSPRKEPAFITMDSPELGTKLSELFQTREDLKVALDSGLAENHPRVKSLRALLAMRESEVLAVNATKPAESEADKLEKEIEDLKKAAEKEKQKFRQDAAEMKGELQRLREEINTLKKEKNE